MAMGRLWMKSYSWTSFSVNHPSTILRLQTWTVIAQPRGQGALGLSAPTFCSYRSCSFAWDPSCRKNWCVKGRWSHLLNYVPIRWDSCIGRILKMETTTASTWVVLSGILLYALSNRTRLGHFSEAKFLLHQGLSPGRNLPITAQARTCQANMLRIQIGCKCWGDLCLCVCPCVCISFFRPAFDPIASTPNAMVLSEMLLHISTFCFWRVDTMCFSETCDKLHLPWWSPSSPKGFGPIHCLAQKAGCDAALISCSSSQMSSPLWGSTNFKMRNSVWEIAMSSVS